jgi:hypothetical protein
MHFGVPMFPTDYAIRPDELARAPEERGFESMWVPEHTHIPASRRSPWPGGLKLPKEYWMPIGFRAPGTVAKIPALREAAAKATVDQLGGAGVDRVVFMAPSEPRDKVLPLLDAYAAVSR